MCKEEFAKAIDKAIFPGLQGGPLMHVIAAKAVAFKEDLEPAYKEYCKQVIANARELAATLTKRGFRIVSGGTDSHLFLLDLTDKNLTGKESEIALGLAGITVNKNTIPRETRSPFITSGIRIGTPAVTTKGMKEAEMRTIGDLIAEVLLDVNSEAVQKRVKENVMSLCGKFRLYK